MQQITTPATITTKQYGLDTKVEQLHESQWVELHTDETIRQAITLFWSNLPGQMPNVHDWMAFHGRIANICRAIDASCIRERRLSQWAVI
jgi:endonuclease III